MDAFVFFQTAAPSSLSKHGIAVFEVGKRSCARKISGLERPVGYAGSFPSRNAVLVAPMSLFGNRFSAAVYPWPSWPARLQVATRGVDT